MAHSAEKIRSFNPACHRFILSDRGSHTHCPRGSWYSSISTGWFTAALLKDRQVKSVSKNYFTSSDPHHDIYTFCYILSDISSGIRSGILSGISSGILPGISSGILSGISSGILSDILPGVLSGISSRILSDMLSGVLSGISSGILSGRWGPVVLTELGRSQAEVQRCSLSSEGPRLRPSGAHSYRTPAVEVQQCPLHAEVGEELARRKWTWKCMQRWWRRSWRRGRRRRRRWRMRRRRRRRRRTTVIKSNNPHLAGGESVMICTLSASFWGVAV